MEEELDPEIAALLSNADKNASESDEILNNIEEIEEYQIPSNRKSLFTKTVDEVVHATGSKSVHDVDLSKKEFAPLPKLLNDEPAQFYNDTKYYKIIFISSVFSFARSILILFSISLRLAALELYSVINKFTSSFMAVSSL